jgi:hypothetical protein
MPQPLGNKENTTVLCELNCDTHTAWISAGLFIIILKDQMEMAPRFVRFSSTIPHVCGHYFFFLRKEPNVRKYQAS